MLVSEVSSGRDFAILFMKLVSRGRGRDFASCRWDELDEYVQGFASGNE